MATLACSSYQKDIGAFRISWTLVHNVIAHCLQRFWLEQIDDAFGAGLGADPLRMVRSIPDDHPFASILEIFQVKIEDFTWPQPSLEHKQKHRLVPLAGER